MILTSQSALFPGETQRLLVEWWSNIPALKAWVIHNVESLLSSSAESLEDFVFDTNCTIWSFNLFCHRDHLLIHFYFTRIAFTILATVLLLIISTLFSAFDWLVWFIFSNMSQGKILSVVESALELFTIAVRIAFDIAPTCLLPSLIFSNTSTIPFSLRSKLVFYFWPVTTGRGVKNCHDYHNPCQQNLHCMPQITPSYYHQWYSLLATNHFE